MSRKTFSQTTFTMVGGLFVTSAVDARPLSRQESRRAPLSIRQIRNATLVIEYAGKRLLIDPMLSPKGTYPPFPNSLRQDERNPLVELPVPAVELVEGIDAVFLSHLHLDHYDDAAKTLLPKGIKVFVQNEADKARIAEAKFTDVEVLTGSTRFEGITLARTRAQHGRGEILARSGQVCGVVLKHPAEKTVYVAADTVWFDGVREAIDTHAPDIIVVNGGDNQFLNSGSLVMGKDDIREVHKAAPKATIIVSHMEAVNHYTLSRADLRAFLHENRMSATVKVPNDGESYAF